MRRKIVFNTIFLLMFAVCAKAQSALFAQLTGSPMNTSGWNLQGAAAVTNVTGTGNSELLLTSIANSQSGSVFFNQPINLTSCNQWKAVFDFRMYDGSGADGIAFCFLDTPPVGFVVGAGLGIPATANGLKVCFDTYNNCNSNTTYQMPKVELRWGQGYTECSTLPTAANEANFLDFVRSSSYVHAEVDYADGNITVLLNGRTIITGFQQFTFNGYMGFTASTGGQTDNHSIKNVAIYTQMPPSYAGVSAASVCPGDTVQLGGPNNAAYSYSWSPSTGLSSKTISNPYAIASNTTGSIQYQKYYVFTSFASNAGCASEDSVTIKVNPGPLVDFAAPIVCLPNGNVTINNETVIYDSTQNKIAYLWTFSDGGTSTQTNPTHNYPDTGRYSIDLKTTSASGCKSEVKKSFTVYPQATATINLPKAFCADSTVVFNGNAPGQVIQTWNWNFGDNTTASVQNPSHSYTTATTYTVTLSAVTNQGCLTDTASKTITINPLPVAGFTYTGLACENQQIHFTDASQPSVGTITAWNWYFDDGTTTTGQTASHGFTPYGQHTVTHTVQNSQGCKSLPYAQQITITPTPVANFGYPFVCENVSANFIDSSTIADGTQSQFIYTWNFGDGSAGGSGATPAHAYAAGGNYPVTLVVTSGGGCADTVSKTITISGGPAVGFKILSTDFCGNLPLQLLDSSSVAFGTLTNIQIFWNFPSLTDYTQYNNPVPGTVYTHSYSSFGTPASQQITVMVQATSSGGCFTQASANASLLATPQLAFQSIPSFCVTSSQPVLLNEAYDSSALTGTGAYSGDGVSNGYFTPSSAGAGTHIITYNYMLADGCADSVQQTVKVDVQPTVSAGQTIVILGGGQTMLQGSASGGDSLTYLWSPGGSLSDSTALQPVAIPASDTYYTLTATNSTGCFDSAGVLVKVVMQPLVPNAFSPNGDGINDTWQIAYLNSYPDCVVEIFNRYGQMLFRSTGYSTPWNGTYNGKPLPIGTYYYIISTKHLPKPLSGPLTILR